MLRVYFVKIYQFVHLLPMLSRVAAVVALAGSAAAFSPMMSMDLGRREVTAVRNLIFFFLKLHMLYR